MNNSTKDLQPDEARRLGENAMHTRFTWAVLFLAFIAGLAALLPLVGDYKSSFNLAFNGILSFIYVILTFGLSYSFYAICHTSFLIVYLVNKCETAAVKQFLERFWLRRYSWFLYRKRNGEIEFRKCMAVSVAVII